MKRAWYTGHAAEELGESAILVGDPDRVDRIGALLTDPVFLPVKRGLKTVTGSWNGARVSVVAFGMGAPIATIVLHEFADLGVRPLRAHRHGDVFPARRRRRLPDLGRGACL